MSVCPQCDLSQADICFNRDCWKTALDVCCSESEQRVQDVRDELNESQAKVHQLLSQCQRGAHQLSVAREAIDSLRGELKRFEYLQSELDVERQAGCEKESQIAALQSVSIASTVLINAFYYRNYSITFSEYP